MRFIDMEEVLPPPEWTARASAALSELRVASASGPAARSVVITRYSELWREVRSLLLVQSHGKCWYCEFREIRSDMPVDHFRPKNRVAEAREAHPGYWWLAFDFGNFRLSCTYCNSRRVDAATDSAGGKGDHFPLEVEANRAYDESDPLSAELPHLLDPTRAGDPALLFFDESGGVAPHPHLCPEDSLEFRRARASINLYHLDHPVAREARRKWNLEIKRRLGRAVAALEESAAGDVSARGRLEEAMRELRRSLDAKEPLSATARSFLLGRRADGATTVMILQLLELLP